MRSLFSLRRLGQGLSEQMQHPSWFVRLGRDRSGSREREAMRRARWVLPLAAAVLMMGGLPAVANAVPVRSCFGLVPTIVGTDDGEVIEGTEHRDVIVGLGGRDYISGHGGDDVICAGAGPAGVYEHETISGGAGDDLVHGGVGRDDIYGNEGRDRLFGGKGSDLVSGNQGRDLVSGGADIDLIGGCENADLLYGGGHRDYIFGGSGDDQLRGGASHDFLSGDDGDDALFGGRGSDYAVLGHYPGEACGGARRGVGEHDVHVDLRSGLARFEDGSQDRLRSISNVQTGYGRDVIIGDAHSNRLGGGYGNDVVKGGSGDDLLTDLGREREYDPDGSDEVRGQGGDDVLRVGAGRHIIAGGAGRDRVSFLDECEKLVADLESDTATHTCRTYVGAFRDHVSQLLGIEDLRAPVRAYASAITFLGDDGPNLLIGGIENESFDGRGGNDRLLGAAGNDTLDGGSGDDELDGGDDVDSADGGGGADRCVGEVTRNCES